MESKYNNQKLIVIVGETATGKSALAKKIATKFNGEIISADSRTIYLGMDIGTDKPSIEDRKQIKHHLIDIRTPDDPLTVSDYKDLADSAIKDILSRGKLPIFVGGSGLYVDSVIYDFEFNAQPNPELRARLEKLTLEELNKELESRNIDPPVNAKNRRHVIRAIETNGKRISNNDLRPNTLLVGFKVDKDDHISKIADRVEEMFGKGLADEVKRLVEKYGRTGALLQTIGYKEFLDIDPKSEGLNIIKQEIIMNTKKYSKRQKTWFKRNKNIQWVSKQIEAVDLVTTFLNK